jgi:membrane fusion protein, multidrug efflux system
MVDPGNIVHASDSSPIATLTKPSAVLFTLSARALNDVRDAMARRPVEVTALSQDNRHTLGTLLLIDNMVDQTSATMRLKAIVRQRGRGALAGRLRQCEGVAGSAPRCAHDSVGGDPTRARRHLRLGGRRRRVVQARPITAGPTTGDVTIITTGLSERERVVVNGQYKLRQKSKVTFTAPPIPAVAKQARAS